MYFSLKKINITPDYSVSMLGYFNNRISQGILDFLYCRLLTLSDGSTNILFIQIDTCLFSYDFAREIREKISKEADFLYENIMIFASHTHTAPALESFFETSAETRYKSWLKEKILDTSKSMVADKPCKIKTLRANYDNLNSNRRWFMKDGRLLTNPPRGSKDLLKPEGPVDRELQAIIIENEKFTIEAILVNISNHTDTIGGNFISADWPGFMEKRISHILKKDITVIPAIAPAGNINHFDFFNKRDQTSYMEAERIGNEYANILLSNLNNSEYININRLKSFYREINIPSREVSAINIKSAKQRIEELKNFVNLNKNLTAEELAAGNTTVEYIFNRELLKYVKNRKESYKFPFQVFLLLPHNGKDDAISIIAIPGEPFVEIGLELKKIKGYRMVFLITLANGYYGYIPLESHFKNGGYETFTTPYNCLTEKAGNIIIETYKDLLKKLIHKRK